MSSYPPYPTGSSPDDDAPRRRNVNVAAMIGGGIVGFILSWLLIAITLFTLYATSDVDSEGGSTTTTAANVLGAAALALPAVITVALLVPARTRYWGAGVLMGFSIGYILGAGACVSMGAFGA